jgi:hypothetical protein
MDGSLDALLTPDLIFVADEVWRHDPDQSGPAPAADCLAARSGTMSSAADTPRKRLRKTKPGTAPALSSNKRLSGT